MEMNFTPEMASPSPRMEVTIPEMPVSAADRLRRRSRQAMAGVAALALAGVALASVVQVSGAVIAAGEVSTQSKPKSVTHLTGGVLKELLVREGMHVRAGDILMRLESDVQGAGARYSGENVASLRAMKARLEAEVAGQPVLAMPAELANSIEPETMSAVARERQIFQVRQSQLAAQTAMLRDQERQVTAEIAGFRQQLQANASQRGLMAPELRGLRNLYKDSLVTINRLNEIERTNAVLIGEAGTLNARIVQANARIGEIRRQIVATRESARSSAGSELNQVVSSLAEGRIREAGARDIFGRTLVRSPQSGVIDAVSFTTPGSVVPPGEEIVRIVPDADAMMVEARVSPADIDQLRIGQDAKVRFSAFNTQNTPEVPGRLDFVSPDRTTDPRTGIGYYRVRVSVDAAGFRRATGMAISSGMPAEVYITTASRSFMAYLFKPMLDQAHRAFRDEQ